MNHFSRYREDTGKASGFVPHALRTMPLILAFALAAVACGEGNVPARPDATPPTTSLETHPEALNAASTAEFSFSGNDDVELAGFECALDDGDWEPCSSPAVYEALSEGEHSFAVRAIDVVGNVDPEPATWQWRIDVTPPSGGSLQVVETITSALEVTVNVTAEDPNGPLEMRFSGDVAGKDHWRPFHASSIVKLDANSEDGERTVAVEFRDGAGNVSEPVSDTVELDRTPPSGSIDVVSLLTGEGTVELALTASDLNAPIEMRLFGDVIDEAVWKPFEPAPTVALAGGDGIKIIRVEFRDAAGNRSQALSTSVFLNLLPPSGSIDVLQTSTTITEVDVKLTVDADHGAVEMRLFGDIFGEGTWRAFEPSVTVTLTGSDGLKEVHVIFRDELGRVSDSAMDTVVLDRLAPGANRWIDASAGFAQTCAIRADGTLWCAGENAHGEVGDGTRDNRHAPVQELTGSDDWIRVSASNRHTCALRANGTLWCWGRNGSGQIGDGNATQYVTSPSQEITGSSDWKSVATGFEHTCGLKRDGTLWCWGTNSQGQLGDGSRTDHWEPTQESSGANDWFRVSAGLAHTCGIKTDGSLWCWGANVHGQLGTGGGFEALKPEQEISYANDWTDVSAGPTHTCGLKGDGTIWCWGYNEEGRLGDGTTDKRFEPTQVLTGSGHWASVSAGLKFTCGVRIDGSLWCWGDNLEGQLGDGSTTDRLEPTREATRHNHWTSVTTGATHACGIDEDGTLKCWGEDFGRLGGGNTTSGSENVPTRESSFSTDWAAVTAGANHTCGQRSSGEISCWGSSNDDRLGLGDDMPGDWKLIDGGGSHTCGVKTDGTLWCWGNASNGRLGAGAGINTSQASPVQEASLSADWSTVSGGNGHTCAVKTDGTLWCWGVNSNGQLGDGSDTARWEPVQEASEDTLWRTVSAGSNHTCAVKTDGSLWCWGSNGNGRLGDDTEEDRLVPTREYTEADNWDSVSAGGTHTCATRTDGTAWCWGFNSSGRLGVGTGTQKYLHATQVVTASGFWTSISTGTAHTCGIQADGRLFCWGNGGHGRLGIASTVSVNSPHEEWTHASDWVEVTTGDSHTCATRSNGTIHCWGRNQANQLGTNRNPLIPGSIARAAEIEAPSTATDVAITLTLRAQDAHAPVEMLLDGDITEEFKGEWIDYAPETDVTLTPDSGRKTVSVQFRDALGNVSETHRVLTILQ